MIACKQVAKALAENRYYELPWFRRIPMFIHIRLCVMCGKYHQQVVDFQKGIRGYLEHEEAGDVGTKIHLSDEAKKRIAEAMKNKS